MLGNLSAAFLGMVGTPAGGNTAPVLDYTTLIFEHTDQFGAESGNSTALSGLSVIDADVGEVITLHILCNDAGVATLSVIGGLTFTIGDGAADVEIEASGTVANINAALASLKWGQDAATAGSDYTVDVTVTDTALASDTQTITVGVRFNYIAYVHPGTGDDNTAIVGSSSKPFGTVEFAIESLANQYPSTPFSSAYSGDRAEIYIMATYTNPITLSGTQLYSLSRITFRGAASINSTLSFHDFDTVTHGTLDIDIEGINLTTLDMERTEANNMAQITSGTIRGSLGGGITTIYAQGGTWGSAANSGTNGQTGYTGGDGDPGADGTVESPNGQPGGSGFGPSGPTAGNSGETGFHAHTGIALVDDALNPFNITNLYIGGGTGQAGGAGGNGCSNCVCGTGGAGGNAYNDMVSAANGGDGGQGGDAQSSGADGGSGGTGGDGGNWTRTSQVSVTNVYYAAGTGGTFGSGGTAGGSNSAGAGGAGGNGVNGGNPGANGADGTDDMMPGADGSPGGDGTSGSLTLV